MASQTIDQSAVWPRLDLPSWLVIGALIAFLAASAIFMSVPELDLAVANWFFTGGHNFIGNVPDVEFARNLFKLLFIATCAAAVVGLALDRLTHRSRFGMNSARCLFLLSCLVIGPGVVTNVALKDHWGRARPRDVVQFGGDKAFSGPLVVSKQCAKNCSFVSGEASSIFMIFFAAAFLFRKRAIPLIVAGLISGTIAGLIRMAQGGHFLSDVIFAGVAMALTAALIYRLFEEIAPEVQGPPWVRWPQNGQLAGQQ